MSWAGKLARMKLETHTEFYFKILHGSDHLGYKCRGEHNYKSTLREI